MRFVLCLIVILSCSFFSGSVEASWDRITLSVASDQRFAWVYEPEEAADALAVVVVLHGHGGRAQRMARVTGFNALAEQMSFLAVYPEGKGWAGLPPQSWNAGYCCGYSAKKNISDVAFIVQLVAELKQNFGVDAQRVYVVGASNGGMLALRLACEHPELFAAAGVVAGSMQTQGCQPKEPISIISLHGMQDQLVPYLGGESQHAKESRVDAAALDVVSFWAQHNQCEKAPIEKNTDTWVSLEYPHCRLGTAVTHFGLKHQGHAWPGGKRGWLLGDKPAEDLLASTVIWNFFAAHPKTDK